MEGAGEIGGFLADHRIHHQQHLIGRCGFADPHHLLHHRLIDLEPAGRIHQHGVETLGLGLGDASGGDRFRLGLGPQAEHLHPDLTAQGGELVDGGGTVHVGRHQQGLAPLLLEVEAELGRGRGFAGPLQACHQHHRGAFAVPFGEGGVFAAHGLHQLLMHQLDELLVGADPAHHLGADGFAAHLLDKVLHHRQAHVGLEQGPAHLLQGTVHVGFADAGLAPQAFDGVFKSLGKLVKHRGLARMGRSPCSETIVKKRVSSQRAGSSPDARCPHRGRTRSGYRVAAWWPARLGCHRGPGGSRCSRG